MTSPEPTGEPTSPQGRKREALQNGAALLLSAIIVVTCSATSAPSSPATPSLPSEILTAASKPSAPPQVALSASAPPALPLASAVPPPPPPRDPQQPLARFHAALASLTSGERSSHVRILWLGDSHTAADLWTGEVRRALQGRYGNGGPGFVHAGWEKYRHEQVQTKVSGKWRVQPGDYARMKRYDDGVLGLGGVRHVPKEGGASAVLVPRNAQEATEYTWDIAYRLPNDAALELKMGDKQARALPGKTGAEILHHQARTTGAEPLKLTATQGTPQLFGVVIEARKPGVVLDAIGLNGARTQTFLAWEPGAWLPEVTRRKPDLVVLAFGTNESSDVAPEASRYEEAARRLLERVRQAAPSADCLVITPMDRAGPEFSSRLAVISEGLTTAARQGGCEVWSATAAMGGPGGMARWAAEHPARGGADGIHLTARGYQSLGEHLARDLMPDATRKAGLPLESKAP